MLNVSSRPTEYKYDIITLYVMFSSCKQNADHIHEKSEAFTTAYVCGIRYYVCIKSSVFCSLADM
jgi:hypothetical protein